MLKNKLIKQRKNIYTDLLFSSLRSALFNEEIEVDKFMSLTEDEWQCFYSLVVNHGVCGMVYDIILKLPAEALPARKLKLQWALSYEAITARSHKQMGTIDLLASQMDSIDVKLAVLKGISFAAYYPNPLLRECGDCDAYMFGEHGRAEEFLKSLGVHILKEDYKHSHFIYRGLFVENHRFCSKVREGNKAIRYEQAMHRYLYDESKQRYFSGESKIILPCDEFNILMYLRHSSVHFLTEGLTLRHLCDWCMILNKASGQVDWNELVGVMSLLKLEKFAFILTRIVDRYFGQNYQFNMLGLNCDIKLEDRVLDDMLYGLEPLYSTAKSGMKERWGIVKYSITHVWKYHKVMNKSVIAYVLNSLNGILFKKNPKI